MSTQTVLSTVDSRKSSASVPQPVDAALGDWPLSLMLDEAWLRARRILVHKLEKAALWMETDSYNSFKREQRELGSRLKGELLRQVLGPRDYALLNSETIFGPSNNRFRAKISLVLAFGYELGAGLHTVLGGRRTDQTAKAGELAAVFNLGISTFDLVCDHCEDLFGEFSETFNEEVLRSLGHDSQAPQMLAAKAEDVAAGELRLLLKLIAWFFQELHNTKTTSANGRPVDARIRRKLATLLRDAYRAEVLSSAANAPASEADLIAISRRKSTLPFAIIYQVALLLSGRASGHIEKSAAGLARYIATIFWLTDDLSDVVRDLQSGDLNSILLQAGFKPNNSRDPVRDYPVLTRLLAGNYFEKAADRIREQTASALSIIDSVAINPDAANRFRQVVQFYVRGWL